MWSGQRKFLNHSQVRENMSQFRGLSTLGHKAPQIFPGPGGEKEPRLEVLDCRALVAAGLRAVDVFSTGRTQFLALMSIPAAAGAAWVHRLQ